MRNQRLDWQEWQGSNLRPPVLETGALPIELHSYALKSLGLCDGAENNPRTLLPCLLPNGFIVGFLYGSTHYPVNRLGGVPLHVRHQVRIDVHGDGDAAMAKALLHDLGMDVLCQDYRGCRRFSQRFDRGA